MALFTSFTSANFLISGIHLHLCHFLTLDINSPELSIFFKYTVLFHGKYHFL